MTSVQQASEQQPAAAKKKEDVMVQYVIIRRDLQTELKWPLGSLISQGCHAVVACLAENYQDETTQKYISKENIDKMHKVTLEVANEAELLKMQKTLQDNEKKHRLWIELPENIPTAIAVKPYWKSEIFQIVKKLKLFK